METRDEMIFLVPFESRWRKNADVNSVFLLMLQMNSSKADLLLILFSVYTDTFSWYYLAFNAM